MTRSGVRVLVQKARPRPLTLARARELALLERRRANILETGTAIDDTRLRRYVSRVRAGNNPRGGGSLCLMCMGGLDRSTGTCHDCGRRPVACGCPDEAMSDGHVDASASRLNAPARSRPARVTAARRPIELSVDAVTLLSRGRR